MQVHTGIEMKKKRIKKRKKEKENRKNSGVRNN